MIDDLTVVLDTSHLGDLSPSIPHRMKPMTCPDGLVRPWQLIRVQGAVILHQPDTYLMRVKLSYPRLAYQPHSAWTYNYPLCPNPAALSLGPVSVAILSALDVPLRPSEDPVERLGLLDAGVVRVAYAFDAHTENGEETLVACSRLTRSHARQVQSYSRPGQPPHAFEFEANHKRLMIYRKDEEIRARIRPLRGRARECGQLTKAVRDAMVNHARDVVRIELTLKDPSAIRALWDLPGGLLPTLRSILRPEVGAYLLARELAAMGLLEVEAGEPANEPLDDGNTETKDGDALTDRLMAQFEAVSSACRGFSEAGCVGASRSTKGIQGTRVLLLTMTGLLRGRLSDEAIREKCGGISDGAYRGLLADLKAIGVPAGVQVDHLGLLRRLVAEFRRQHPKVPEKLPELSDDDIVEAPWADCPGLTSEAPIEDVMLGGEDCLFVEQEASLLDETGAANLDALFGRWGASSQ